MPCFASVMSIAAVIDIEGTSAWRPWQGQAYTGKPGYSAVFIFGTYHLERIYSVCLFILCIFSSALSFSSDIGCILKDASRIRALAFQNKAGELPRNLASSVHLITVLNQVNTRSVIDFSHASTDIAWTWHDLFLYWIMHFDTNGTWKLKTSYLRRPPPVISSCTLCSIHNLEYQRLPILF